MPLTSNHNLTVFDFAADNISEKVQVMFVTSQSDVSTQKHSTQAGVLCFLST